MFEDIKFRKFGTIKDIDNRFFCSKEYRFIYCETPKVGISTIKKTLAEIITNETIDVKILHDREKYPLKTPNRMGLSKEEFDEFFKFAFVRNPYTRILSGYLNKIVGNKPSKKGILKFMGIKDFNYEVSFREFLEVLELMEPKSINPYFRPQYLHICIPIIKYDFIGKFENFHDDFLFILNKIFNKNEIKILKPHQTNASSKDKLKKFYSKKEIDLVQKIYAQDFLYFGYSFDLFKER